MAVTYVCLSRGPRRYILFSKGTVMASFRKQEDCPTSQELLSYQLGDLDSAESRVIGKHLAVCEFCSSEVDFYERYPVSRESEENSEENAQMPKPLFELAEALLNRKRGSQSIADLMKDLESAAHDKR